MALNLGYSYGWRMAGVFALSTFLLDNATLYTVSWHCACTWYEKTYCACNIRSVAYCACATYHCAYDEFVKIHCARVSYIVLFCAYG